MLGDLQGMPISFISISFIKPFNVYLIFVGQSLKNLKSKSLPFGEKKLIQFLLQRMRVLLERRGENEISWFGFQDTGGGWWDLVWIVWQLNEELFECAMQHHSAVTPSSHFRRLKHKKRIEKKHIEKFRNVCQPTSVHTVPMRSVDRPQITAYVNDFQLESFNLKIFEFLLESVSWKRFENGAGQFWFGNEFEPNGRLSASPKIG